MNSDQDNDLLWSGAKQASQSSQDASEAKAKGIHAVFKGISLRNVVLTTVDPQFCDHSRVLQTWKPQMCPVHLKPLALYGDVLSSHLLTSSSIDVAVVEHASLLEDRPLLDAIKGRVFHLCT